jgi:hypothetical protein
MKTRKIKNRKRHLKFETLIDVLDFSHISYEIDTNEIGKKIISNIFLYSLCNVEDYGQITYFNYNVYLSPILYSKLLDFSVSEIPEDRPDGDAWQDDSYSSSSLKGNPNAKYYKLSHFFNFFADSECQWCPEAAMFNKAIILFEEATDKEYIDVIYTSKDTDMLLGVEEDENKNDNFYYDNPRKYSDDWMDDPENYWNID